MSEAVRSVSASCVILPGHVWQLELSAELERLGMDPAKAPAAAAHALHRIVGHHGWPQGVIEVASSDGDQAADLEVSAEDAAPKRSRAVSRRRWAEAAK
jgi:hypothetical protein